MYRSQINSSSAQFVKQYSYKTAFVTKNNKTLRAHHIPGDRRNAQTCPHCGVGQLRPRKNKHCAFCDAIVTTVK